MIVLFIIGVLLLGLGVVLVTGARGSTARGGTAASIEQIESYGFSARMPEDRTARPSLMSVVARLGTVAQRGLGVGDRGIRQELLAAGMYNADPMTIIGYRVLLAIGMAGIWIWYAAANDKSPGIMILGTIFLGALGYMLPVMIIRRRGRKRIAQIDYEL